MLDSDTQLVGLIRQAETRKCILSISAIFDLSNIEHHLIKVKMLFYVYLGQDLGYQDIIVMSTNFGKWTSLKSEPVFPLTL